MKEKVIIKKENPFSEVSTVLIRELSKELAKRYEFTYDGSGGFQPEDVTVEKAAFLVVWINEEPIACGAVRPLFENEIAEIKRMFVKPEFRGNGIARLLLKKLESLAVEMGYKKIWLETGDRQPEAIRLYENTNYSRIINYGNYKENLHNNCFEKVLLND
ncbi:MAG: GNAT family N-acetyltransferase [Prolixibacteraceae bacterium]|jgi:putative acetyltransferase|nr:GNAT family N-acetyltransferase [Prolixibacteraceae bacterium]MBT6005935.1 GNAT family N-acetyltransferase [Prolixibacteraceae bacterium]MBT6765242.1 GNAT family N-acetyltransferase [Prolixibacteraceae bacterium]MBT6999380.1 GNAT family N-acetyltransferase [Prolixibacteraceae bacterium]MBT7395242.1 GNAT family N-acetyltransferase [Prolixibacteraceae bacterium]